MAYNEELAERMRRAFGTQAGLQEKKMFGGLAFMLEGHMCCGVIKDEIMVRVGPEGWEEALAQPHAREMDFTGRSIKGMVYVGAEGCGSDAAARGWVRRGMAFVRTLPPKA